MEMITIDYTSRLPLYEQIVERFQMLIIKGILPSGSQIPSVRALAVDLALNPNTIQKAYSMLEQQGYIFSVKGRGNFVADVHTQICEKQNRCKADLKELVSHARELDISEEECHRLIEEIYHTEVSHD